MSERRDEGIDPELVATRAWDARLVARLAGFARPHAAQFARSLLVLALLFAVELTGPYVWRLVLDGPVGGALSGRLSPAEALADLDLLVLLYGLLALAQAGLSFLEIAQFAAAGERVVHDLRVRVFEHLERLDLGYFDQRATGSLVTRLTTDVKNVSELLTSGLVVLAFDVVKILALVGVLFWIHPGLALVVTALTPVLIGISLLFRGGARAGFRLVRAHLSRLNGYLQEVLSGIRTVQMFHREARVSRRFGERLDGYLAANLRTLKLFALFFPAVSLTVFVIQMAVLRVAGRDLLAGELEVGVFYQFWFYLALLVSPIRELGERYNVLQAALASAERIFQVLDTEPAVRAPEGGAREPGGGDPLVRFERVDFDYVPGTPVLRGVDLEIPRGATVAVVGPTGAGKSTLVNLVLRFHDPTAGRVLFGGVDLRELDPRELRRRCGLVLQEEFLFEGTVRENVALGRPEVDEARVRRALEMACAADLVARLPDGLDTRLGERGVLLSRGERQLLTIARALAGDPELVILDEATASVDSETEARVEAATRNLLAGRSSLVIAHRLSTIRDADRILVLHHGRLRESGTHTELLAAGGLYARLHALQFADEAGGSAAGPPGSS